MIEDNEDEWDYDTGDYTCPPHLYVLCALCGNDTCDDCGQHFVDEEEMDECPALKVTSSSTVPES